jgi:Zn-dependent peptidase ImmA (M78 family)
VGRRSSLAHEICHLLVDREQGVPLAEAIVRQSSSAQEVRARAFAAALLLPKRLASAEWSQTSDGGLKGLVRSLQKRLGVSAEIVAWQLRNSAVALSADEVAYLRGLVSAPNEF